ncbi:MAG: HAMP domain-containing sensor histidine kinase [Pseudomonadota bacterium]
MNSMNLSDVRSKSGIEGLSLKARLGIGAAILGAGTLLTALILYLGMQMVAARLETALQAETRMARYAALSTQAATFLVVATEAVQTGQPTDERMARITPIVSQIHTTFQGLSDDVEKSVLAAQHLGLDAQSRYGTQSLGLARMKAMLESTMTGLQEDTDDRARLRAFIDSFATGFDPLLSQAVNTERLFRNATLAGVADVRHRLSATAVGIAGLTLLAVGWFYLGLIRPQFRRLDRLRKAAAQIGQADFAIALPEERKDEIGALYEQTNRMAEALSERQDAVNAEWDRLNETIAERTRALQSANEQLSEIDENRRRFFADVSHELRTPLTVILMEAQIGQQQGADAAEAFATIQSRAARLNRRIDDLLRVARSDTGQLALDTQEVNLSDLMRAVLEEVQAELETADMELSVGTLPDATLCSDPNWARQVLVGLIRNAVRHAREGGKVSLGAAVRDTFVDVFVTDNGTGLDASAQDRLFSRFEQGDVGRSQGFGIGLALSKWVIEEQGGDIRLISPVPREAALGASDGTQVVVSLPRKMR